ncbi:pleckstrin homology domain-containing family J member 1-like [Daktulosphaira vitifoliae]|uniref:pleckstrin homology domain-containing family J member 1-like n=1 Tax=Daktulosphaira vitifoliae TaxID=58002 RepID=UPI0021AA0080|nr:pleckstrin homology domain-containing family J member 1-like [Daktulosphaira vitifoliae]XP_050540755.1 pleckstrin homology domain-containing family J member 1-like [Daktulosphaira vitifoliae]
MRFNSKELIHVSHSNPILEGRMSYAKLSNGYPSKGFKERWFKLKYNLLFYFKINCVGHAVLNQPAGVFVLENSVVRPENNIPGTFFSFSLSFKDEPDKKYIISSQSEDHVQNWINCIQSATYEYMRTQLSTLQNKILILSGKDPLLLYPEDSKKINQSNTNEFVYKNLKPAPRPPPRHKSESVNSNTVNLIEL